MGNGDIGPGMALGLKAGLDDVEGGNFGWGRPAVVDDQVTCHCTERSGAEHETGDNAGWAQRLAQGYDTLVKHAIEGIRAMPAKGGNTSLSDDEVKAAVDYMANQSGAKF